MGRWPLLRRGTVLAVASAGVAGLAVAALAVSLVAHASVGQAPGSAPRPSGIPVSVPISLVNLMELSSVPHALAPGFTLTDQAGHAMPLASLRGRVVVLEFMDPHCTDICPIVSQEFLSAYRDLGSLRTRVVFAAVNVNQYHLRVADVAAFSQEQGLTAIPSWHFFTGPYPALRAVWRAYGVAAYAPSRNADVIHSSLVFFIDPRGRERFLATPMVDHAAGGASYLPPAQLAEWGRGFALVARQLASR